MKVSFKPTRLLGHVINTDLEKMLARETSPTGHLDEDIPLLQSLRVMKKNKKGGEPEYIGKSDEIKQFFRWAAGSEKYPLPPLVRRILCMRRFQLIAAMEALKTTDPMRTYERNAIAEIDRFLREDGMGPPPVPENKEACETDGASKEGSWSHPALPIPEEPATASTCDFEAILKRLGEMKIAIAAGNVEVLGKMNKILEVLGTYAPMKGGFQWGGGTEKDVFVAIDGLMGQIASGKDEYVKKLEDILKTLPEKCGKKDDSGALAELQAKLAEAEKAKADAEKTKAEAEKAKADAEKAKAEAEKLLNESLEAATAAANASSGKNVTNEKLRKQLAQATGGLVAAQAALAAAQAERDAANERATAAEAERAVVTRRAEDAEAAAAEAQAAQAAATERAAEAQAAQAAAQAAQAAAQAAQAAATERAAAAEAAAAEAQAALAASTERAAAAERESEQVKENLTELQTLATELSATKQELEDTKRELAKAPKIDKAFQERYQRLSSALQTKGKSMDDLIKFINSEQGGQNILQIWQQLVDTRAKLSQTEKNLEEERGRKRKPSRGGTRRKNSHTSVRRTYRR
jgi:hypothetical protein